MAFNLNDYDQESLDNLIYATIRQTAEAPLSVSDLYDLKYLTNADVYNPIGLRKEPIPLTGIDIARTIDWCRSRGGHLAQMAGQLELFVSGAYVDRIPIPGKEIYQEIGIAASTLGEDHLKMKAYLFLVADYVAYSGRKIVIEHTAKIV
jgi:hypothetical protein